MYNFLLPHVTSTFKQIYRAREFYWIIVNASVSALRDKKEKKKTTEKCYRNQAAHKANQHKQKKGVGN